MGIDVSDDEFDLDFARSSGPGGQNVNKVNSKVVLKWNVNDSAAWAGRDAAKQRFLARYKKKINKEGFLVVHCQETRNQGDNIRICKEKLRDMIAEIEPEPKPRVLPKPSKTARQIRREQKIIVHRIKQQRLKNKRVQEE